jgi:CrcB protein
MVKNLILVGLGGGIGSIFRYLTSLLIIKNQIFPFATLIVNIIGCLLIGFLSGFLMKNNILSDGLRLLFVVGFCGGFTTFSAFSFENIRLIETGNYLYFITYTMLSVGLGIAAVWLGSFLNKIL